MRSSTHWHKIDLNFLTGIAAAAKVAISVTARAVNWIASRRVWGSVSLHLNINIAHSISTPFSCDCLGIVVADFFHNARSAYHNENDLP